MRIYILSLLAFFGTSLFAQSTLNTMTFKGIPINGTLNEFVLKMTDSGFSYLKTEKGSTFLQGDFAGFKDCTLIVHSDNNIVNSLIILTTKYEDWTSLEGGYELLKLGLTQKYGEPISCTEEIQTYSPNPKNSRKIKLAKSGNVTYRSLFETPNGYINLSIEKNQCKIIYYPKNVFITNEKLRNTDL